MQSKEEIVISGISGRYPECNNVKEFAEALFNGVDLVTDNDRRFPKGVMGIPPRCGKLPELDKFDATFFGFHAKQVEFMDPRHRILCETAYECIIDAGYNPQELRGSNTGVYVGIGTFMNLEKMREREDTDGYSNTGYHLSMAANRISFFFDFKGKSYSMDSACSSSLTALDNAVQDLIFGKIDAALVCGTHILPHPHETAEYAKLNMLAPDGMCKTFSTKKNGFVRSEAVVSVLLQKKSVSRRLYATVLGTASNVDGYKIEGITFPSTEMQVNLLQKVYHEQGINPNEVSYVEAHGTGTAIGDRQELQAIADIFCKNRKTSLLVGSVKSNMGHAELAAGMCSISKVLVGMEAGVIPANLHTIPLDTDLPGIKEKTIKVVTENIPWGDGIAGLSSFGFGGSNIHVALKANSKEKSKVPKNYKYRLVQVSGRTEEAVNYFLDEVEKNTDGDEEFLALVDDVYKINFDGHSFRGYTILGKEPKRGISNYTKKRPIWFIYTGMGAQWLGMGKDLMRNEIFRNTIKRCADALKPHNVNLEEILTSTVSNTFDNVVNSFSGIAAVEIAMTDVLYSLGIKPDGIAGHSLGEVGCSYANGGISPEQAVLLAYARGYASQCGNLPAGLMAVVGLSKDECLKILPDDIYIACHNGKKSVTIGGPAASVNSLIEKITSQGIFIRKVNTGGIAYHTKYIRDAGPYFHKFIKNIFKTQSRRSSKWVSTSVAEHQKGEPWAQYNCAEYHLNNFLSPVLFDGIYKHIPKDAIVVEVAPHGLLQSIIKQEVDPSVTILSLGNRNSLDNEEWFLTTIGKIYLAGGQPNLKKLYKDVTYPVSRGTKMLGPLVKWDHSVSWFVPLWSNENNFSHIIRVNISKPQYAHLADHNVDGKIIMPAIGYLDLAWRTLAKLHLTDVENCPVVIENTKFNRAVVLPSDREVVFLVIILKQTNHFEIVEGGTVVCSGSIYVPKNVDLEYLNIACPEIATDDSLPLTSEDFYKEMCLRRHKYQGCFKSIKECNVHGTRGKITWQNNFTCFLDALLQIVVFSVTRRDILIPTFIDRIIIDPKKHKEIVEGRTDIPVFYNQNVNVVKSGGVEVCGLDLSKISRPHLQEDPVLETYEFLSYETRLTDTPDFETCLPAAVQIIIQNKQGFIKHLKICEFPGQKFLKPIEKLKKILDLQPFVEVEYSMYNRNEDKPDFDVILVTDKCIENVDITTIKKCLVESGMILYIGDIGKMPLENCAIIFKTVVGENGIHLLRPHSILPSKYSVVHVTNSKFDWLDSIRSLIQNSSHGIVYLVSQYEERSGIVGLVKCLLTEPDCSRFKCILIQDSNADAFSMDNIFYRNQLAKNLTFNILRNGQWGTFIHLPFKLSDKKEAHDAFLSILNAGDLSTLTWVERSPIYIEPNSGSEEVYVYYSALNFKDVLLASGNLPPIHLDQPTISDIAIGSDYAGITTSGRRVMGFTELHGFSLQVQSDEYFTWEVPKEWSLDEAATIPCVYATCYYAMIVRGRLRHGESILIHLGSGGVGIAAIAIALNMSCTVYTTVGSQEKKEYVKKMYPQLQTENIGCSRNSSFRKMVMENTNGKGVDVVLNSLSGDLFNESLKCVAPNGRFLELGKTEFVKRTPIESNMFLRNRSFHAVCLSHLFISNSNDKEHVRKLLSEGITKGTVKPLPRKIFKEMEVEDAFRLMTSGKHKGKLLIELRKENSFTVTSPTKTTINAIPRVYFDPRKCYILIGGLGGLGLELADWLIKKGATKIILNSKSQVKTGYQSYCLKKWSKLDGITVKISTDDTTILKGAKDLISSAKLLGPVGGVFNMALVLKDALIQNQTAETFEAVFRPKVISGQHMDIVTRTECPALDHFVVFSSLTCGRGNTGQSNYGMANSVLEQLCERRRIENLPALAVQWGSIGEAGFVVQNKITNKFISKIGNQSIRSCLQTLEQFMLQGSVIGSTVLISSKIDNISVNVTSRTAAKRVAHILGIRNLDLVDKSSTLLELGLDSLILSEIKQTLLSNFQLDLSTEEIRNLTFSKLLPISGAVKDNCPMITKKEDNHEMRDIKPPLLSKEPVVKMNGTVTGRRTIFIIPHIEGVVNDLNTMASHLKATVYGLEFTKETDFDNIEEYARYFTKQIKIIQPQGPYVLCGFCFGAALAMEVGIELEKTGDLVSVVSLDGSPALVSVELQNYHLGNEMTLQNVKNTVLDKFLNYFPSINHKNAIEQLSALKGWEKQLQLVGELVSQQTGLNSEHVSASVDGYYKRCLAGTTYKPQSKFNGKMVLVKADGSDIICSEDYSLRKHCDQEIEIVYLKGSHHSILCEENAETIASKINSLL